jgi:CarD family transcriptional regulator
MTKVQLELSEGDWVVHNRHGLGQITGMDTKELLGDRKVFYVVKTEAITYWLPVAESGSERIRPVASAETFSEALEVAAREPKPMEENFRRRLAYIQSQIQDSSLLAKAALIRDMYARNVQKDIHVNEKKILDTLSQQFINEWVAACDISYDEAQAELRKALKKSSVNLKPKKSPF